MIKALVIDDEALLRELFEQMLIGEGYDVKTASNGEEALEMMRSKSYDVVLLDLMLGPISGFTVLEEIQQMYYPPIVLVMTGYGSTDVAIEAMKQGAADFITKPVDPDVLDIRIRKAIEERQAQHLAITDGLTSLYNRRYFEERLEEETRRARRYDRPMSIMMLDIDFFKQYNDTNGHLKGDQALRQIAQILQSHSRETDITARYGGEEFVMILPETDENARQLGERIRKSVENTAFEGEEDIPSKKITISIGVSCLSGEEDGHGVLERADQALYKSKQAGRNRLTIMQ